MKKLVMCLLVGKKNDNTYEVIIERIGRNRQRSLKFLFNLLGIFASEIL